jgi:flavodoxin short chain
MKKVAIVYWSGTGNTELMAKNLAYGAKRDTKIKLMKVNNIEIKEILDSDILALGSPALEGESIEKIFMEPFVSFIEKNINKKDILLFGSYDWGSGKWMQKWVNRMKSKNSSFSNIESFIIQNTPNNEQLEFCRKYGSSFF